MSEVFIYCDDASHTRRTAVNKFRQGPDGQWLEARPASNRSTSVSLGKDDTPMRLPSTRPGGGPPLIGGADFGARTRWRLVCWKCTGRAVEVRDEKLSPVLDKLALQGVSEVPLTIIAAMLRVQSKSD